jgi:hypothetical protein
MVQHNHHTRAQLCSMLLGIKGALRVSDKQCWHHVRAALPA